MRRLSEIGEDISAYIVSKSPQIVDNKVIWYLGGSLAMSMLGEAQSITEVVLDETGKIKEELSSKNVSEEQRKKIRKFSRKLGVDVDIILVNGRICKYNSREKIGLSVSSIKEKIPDSTELMSWKNDSGGLGYLDYVKEDYYPKCPIAKIKTEKGEVLITSLPELIANKLIQIMILNRIKDKREKSNKDYYKDIQDMVSMIYGYKDLYGNDELIDRICQ